MHALQGHSPGSTAHRAQVQSHASPRPHLVAIDLSLSLLSHSAGAANDGAWTGAVTGTVCLYVRSPVREGGGDGRSVSARTPSPRARLTTRCTVQHQYSSLESLHSSSLVLQGRSLRQPIPLSNDLVPASRLLRLDCNGLLASSEPAFEDPPSFPWLRPCTTSFSLSPCTTWDHSRRLSIRPSTLFRSIPGSRNLRSQFLAISLVSKDERFRDWSRPKGRRLRFGRLISWMRRKTDTERASPKVDSRSEAVEVVPDSHTGEEAPRGMSGFALLSSPAIAVDDRRTDNPHGLFPVSIDPPDENPAVLSTIFLMRWFDEIIIERRDYVEGVPRLIKQGTEVTLEEGEIAHWVWRNTTVPVPKVCRVGTNGALPCVEFEYVKGTENLDDAWPTLDLAAKKAIGDELVEAIRATQDAPSPAHGLIASYQRDRACGLRAGLRPEWPTYRPTASTTEFFDWARQCALTRGMSPATWDSKIAPHIRLDTRIVLTHGDLFPRNLLIRDGHLAAIVDWELAGWWPEELEAAIVLRALLDRPTDMATADNEVAACWFIADCIDRARAGDEGDVTEQSRRREWANMQLWDCARPKERRGRFTRFISWMRRRTDKEKVTHEAVSRCDAVEVVPVSPNFPTPVNDGPATAAGSFENPPRTIPGFALLSSAAIADERRRLDEPRGLFFPIDFDRGETILETDWTFIAATCDAKVWLEKYKTGTSRAIKQGKGVLPEEAEVTHWVWTNTSVPVPQVMHADATRSTPRLEFEYIDGKQLDEVWPTLAASERQTIADELVRAIQAMQDAPAPANGLIGSYQRLRAAPFRPDTWPQWPPYEPTTSAIEFFDWVRRCALAIGMASQTWDSEIAPHIRLDTKIMLTHGDLFPRNILIRDGHLAAIVDWELAGWWPEELEGVISGLRSSDQWTSRPRNKRTSRRVASLRIVLVAQEGFRSTTNGRFGRIFSLLRVIMGCRMCMMRSK
ncbi:hypothetical protein OF846_003837 [Rhodotorula toruloides]|nr:hypothetical protein OF846_003837 [Rhodotorula toruloides]